MTKPLLQETPPFLHRTSKGEADSSQLRGLVPSRYAETLSLLPVLEELTEELVDELLEVLLEDSSKLSRSTIKAASSDVELDELVDELFDGGGGPFFIADWTSANALFAADRSPESRALPNAVMALSILEVASVFPDLVTC